MVVPAFKRLAQRARHYGVGDALQHTWARLVMSLAGPGVHRMDIPGINQLAGAGHIHSSAEGLLEQHFASEAPREVLASIVKEFEPVFEDLRSRYPESAREAAPEWLRREHYLLLYAVTRIRRPTIVVETGVAKGRSSFVLLRALNVNGRGTLHSVDIKPNVGILLRDSEKERWRFHLVDPKDPRASLKKIFRETGPVDVFIHDSDHSYQWSTIELEMAYPHLAPRALVMSDDADISFSFLDHCRAHKMTPLFLLERGLTYAIAKKDANP